MSSELIELINSKILSYSGIYVAKSQFQTLEDHIKKQSKVRGISPLDFVNSLTPHTPDFDEVINLVTVNETYFFREEKQFDFFEGRSVPEIYGKKSYDLELLLFYRRRANFAFGTCAFNERKSYNLCFRY